MKYEIRKRSEREPDIWFPVAWADTWDWASKIYASLSETNGHEFGVFDISGKRICDTEDAMRNG